MRRIATWITAFALAGFALGGALAWQRAEQRFERRAELEAAQPDAAAERVALLGESVRELREDLRALTGQLETNLGALDQRDEERAAEQQVELERGFAGLRAELARASERGERVERELTALAAELAARPAMAEVAHENPELAAVAPPEAPPETTPEPALAAEPEPTPAEPTPQRRASFLAFALPSDDFRPEERRRWTVVPALSRVGFDAKSTLHDFSGTTSEVRGELEVAWAAPELAPSARIAVTAGTLRTGEEGRDEAMLEHLAAEEHPALAFELDAFEPERVDLEAGAVAGRARGRMSIRGVERAVELSVKLSLDETHRLSLEGELELALPDFGVPVPSKLGLIKMDEKVRVWIALRARLEPRSEG